MEEIKALVHLTWKIKVQSNSYVTVQFKYMGVGECESEKAEKINTRKIFELFKPQVKRINGYQLPMNKQNRN